MRPRHSLCFLLLNLLSLCAALPSIFPAEDYAGGCFGMLQNTYSWPKCAGLAKKQLPKCLCALPAVIETSVSCIDQLMADVPVSERDNLRLAVYHKLAKQCASSKLNLSTIEMYHSKKDDLRPYGNERPKALAGKWNATTAFKPSAWECEKSVIAYYGSGQTIPRTNRAGAAILAYWGALLLIRFLVHWISVLLPKSGSALNTRFVKMLRKFFTLPALLKNRHSEAICYTRHIPFNLPTREQSLIIFGFVVLHVCLTFGYNSYYPDSYIYKYDNVYSFNQALAFRTGKMTVFLLPLVILFAGRNNILQWLTGWSHDAFVVYHKWIARCIGFSILTHASAYTVARIHGGTYSSMWKKEYWRWGVAGAIGCCVIVFQGQAAFRRLHYEIFLVLHILLALLFIIGGYYHLKLMHEELQYFYAVFAVWGLDRTLRLLRVLVNNPFAKAEVKLHGDHTLEITASYAQLWKPRPGAYAFIHIVQPTFFWESHPFTLALGVSPGEENKLKVFCRVKDGMTRRALRRALRNGGAFTTPLWIDGPYGPSHNIKAFDEAVFVTGGIGITAPFSYIQAMLEDACCKTSKIALYWAVRDDSALEWFGDQLKYLRTSGRVEVFMFVGDSRQCDPELEREDSAASEAGAELGQVSEIKPGQTVHESQSSESGSDCEKAEPNYSVSSSVSMKDSSLFHVIDGRLDARSIVTNAIKESRGSLGVLCCGPGRMNDDCRFAVTNGLQLTPNFVEYFEESFSW